MLPATAKCNKDRWIKRVISTSTGINGVRLARHIYFESTVTYLFYCILFFERVLGRKHSQESFQKIHRQILFPRSHLKMQRFANSSLRSFPSIVSTAHNFTRDQRVRIKRCFFFFTAGPTEVNRDFLENESDDLSFFFPLWKINVDQFSA